MAKGWDIHLGGRPEVGWTRAPRPHAFMDPAHLKKLAETPVTLTLNAYQYGLLLQWLQVETLERTVKIEPMEPDGQAYAQAVQQLQELDAILASIRAAYRQAAEKLNIPLNDAREGGSQPGRRH
jgi:hypothetical protein